MVTFCFQFRSGFAQSKSRLCSQCKGKFTQGGVRNPLRNGHKDRARSSRRVASTTTTILQRQHIRDLIALLSEPTLRKNFEEGEFTNTKMTLSSRENVPLSRYGVFDRIMDGLTEHVSAVLNPKQLVSPAPKSGSSRNPPRWHLRNAKMHPSQMSWSN